MLTGTTVLIVEDDTSLRETVQLYIEHEGLCCLTSDNGIDCMELVQRFHPDLVVLDIMLPDVNGFEVCQQMRSVGCFMPILMLTARANESDRIRGLAIGADDYLTKPFSAKELVARIKALLRRAYAQGYSDVKRACGVVIDRDRHQAFLNGELLDLRGKEFDLLAQLANYPGRAYSREELLERVWGYDFEGDIRVVDVYIRKLREKIELDSAHPDYIQTVWGVGYRFKVGNI
ncbi:MAG: response regulator transcription factor [Pelatocladus maniniholoensis HA4357-MV3]|jgi:DNA-binding response OmpR family regulator|uniref:Response regulator transcription factor n=1 Tax=Pelatocladus maniniholoensis HA4357-MV3 TaxID=1117104 RepID=A0A9E3LU44_9NOST|nr:response regulator transcription factor [Pelatocladus maniniholoensis HA4357-MV3]BAZ70315.1 two-component response regulator [Fischerella sp. NIES-4106]